MIFSLEFGKIFKRKFNYLFGMIILLISFLLIYKTSGLAGYYDLDEVDCIFKFTFKIYSQINKFIILDSLHDNTW